MQPRHLHSSQIQVDKHICSLSSGLLLSFTFLVSFGKKTRCIGGKDIMLCLIMFLDSKDCGVGHATEGICPLSECKVLLQPRILSCNTEKVLQHCSEGSLIVLGCSTASAALRFQCTLQMLPRSSK